MPEGPALASATQDGTKGMLADYWLAYRLRFLAFRARWTKPDALTGDGPEACRQIAAGADLPPRDRLRAQVFATRIWYRCLLAIGALFIVNEFVAVPLPNHSRPRDLIAEIGIIWLFPMAIAAAQLAATSWRAGWTRRHVLRADRGLDTPGYLLRWGRPRQRDFWLMTVIAVAVVAGILWLSAHPNG
jgi:hypothetical protein